MLLAFIVRNKSDNKTKKVILRTILIILIVLMIFSFILSIAVAFDSDVLNRKAAFFGIFDEFIMNLFATNRFLMIFLIFGIDVNVIGILILLIFFELLYCALKLCISIIFTRNKESLVKLKIVKGKGLPICYCSEAFKVSQIVVIYLLPIIFMYSILYMMMVTYELFAWYIVISFFMTIFMTFDLTAVIYALFCKVKYKIDYIAFDRHLYESNIFKKKD